MVSEPKHVPSATDTEPDAPVYFDPFCLREGILDEKALHDVKRRPGGKRVAKFQNKQNNMIRYLLKSVDQHAKEAEVEEAAARLPVKIAVWASLIANIALCVLQLYAAVSSKSLSLMATGIDSVFDMASNVVLFWLHRRSSRLDSMKWPIGGARLETIGNVIYGFLMSSVNLVVVVESVRSLIEGEENYREDFSYRSIIAVGAALFVKMLLFLYCTPLRRYSSQVKVLWEDHRNDLGINSFGILMCTGGSKLIWYLDPMGAIIISACIILSWSATIYRQFELLAGKSAAHELLQLLLYKSTTHSEDVRQIKDLKAYHVGPEHFVEVGLYMDPETPLWKAREIGNDLELVLESLPSVERAFVRVDYDGSRVRR